MFLLQNVKQVGNLQDGDVLFPMSAILDNRVISDQLGHLFGPAAIAINDVAVYHITSERSQGRNFRIGLFRGPGQEALVRAYRRPA